MKDYIYYVSGYCGYFLLSLVSVRFLIHDDMTGLIMCLIGLLLLITYVEFMEKKNGKPRYSGFIKIAISLVFILGSMAFIYDLV
ncbi:hypothetical protein Q9251_01660 [Alkalihalobacillus macyae]|uniref:hypothetical protein n=1 Tax=Guptibacillus hwajinpoensis TaxID=208199 RepID=UPI00273BA738|nr:hypothetical protein [Alkalihalobacillus macyae]MDP4549584.1 hypothetical protein [Alkalihalobacillus macyae]